ncbi:hypothetical protein [Streptomyces sp. NPDC001536]|uniref:hypothetical protein n=1 Tax=Streptomyces sp. NPDC001536 TaxID=3364583 RepID=UPI0036B81425
MFDFGVEGYEPRWLRGRGAVVREHGDRLAALAGRPLTRVWMVWDLREDEWFGDCPVLFDFDGEQVEVNHWKLDEISLTWNTVDPGRPVRWTDFALEWRAEPLPAPAAVRGLPLRRVELLTWTGKDAAEGNVDVSFVFPDARVTVFNALDENGISFAPPSPRQRSHPLG